MTRKRTGTVMMWGAVFIVAGMFVLPFADFGVGGAYGAVVLAGFNPGAEINEMNVLYWLVPVNALLAVAFAVILWRGIPPRWIGYALLLVASAALAVMLVHFLGAVSEGAEIRMFIWGFWVTIIGIIITGMAYARAAAGF